MPLSNFQPQQYSMLLDEKVTRLKTLLSPYFSNNFDIFASPTSGFRLRAEFRFWQAFQDSNYVMFPKGQNNKPIMINDFPIAHHNINQLMKDLRTEILASDVLCKKLFQVEFLSTLSGHNLISLIYHRPLTPEWQNAATKLEQTLGASIVGRSKKQRIVLSQDYVDEVLSVNGEKLFYRQVEGSFTQPNASVNQHMLSWAQQQLAHSKGDLLELYCGNGNFTVALAKRFNKVLATEISKPSVKVAEFNFSRNKIDNVKVCRLSSEEMTLAFNNIRPFRRLAQQDIDLAEYNFSTVLVDPPRAGLDSGTLDLIQRFDQILYISCNPLTLKDNLEQLCKTHAVTNVAFFDQFPYTDHIETGVFLSKKN